MENISRRSFLLGATCAGAGALSAAVSGCAPSPQTGQTPAGPEGLSDTGEPSFLQVSPIDESIISETLEADVVVVGMGIAGVAALRAAAEEGMRKPER